MQPEPIAKIEQDIDSPSSVTTDKKETGPTTGTTSSAKAAAANGNGQFPPPKTDKPRPHVCGTCGRSFARLEHLKRHERSHTKEKPFECPECTRCFARRDLLLRHQQKLHMTNTTSSRPRAARRESVSGASVSGNARVRKNSVANANAAGVQAGHRPRANTISHIDIASLGLMDNMGPNMDRLSALGLHPSQTMGAQGLGVGFDYRGMSTAMGQHGNVHGLPKLDMNSVNNVDVSNSLRTAPPMATFGASAGFDLDQLFSPGTTVNPAQLHFGGGSGSMSAIQHFNNYEAFSSQHPMIPEGDDFGWMRNWNMQFNATQDNNEQAIDESSPSRMSSGDSPGDYTESLQNSTPALPQMSNLQWASPDATAMQEMQNNAGSFQLNALGSGLPNLDQAHMTLSPSALQDSTPTADAYFHQAMLQHNGQQAPQHQQQHLLQQPNPHDAAHSQPNHFFAPSLSNFSSDSPNMSNSSMGGSARQSSVTSASTDSITDATRQALLSSLSQPSVFGHNHRKYSQPSVSSPLSPGSANARNHPLGANLPSTADIRRYVDAFIQHAHPHIPVTHIPTLSFDPTEYSSSLGAKAALIGSNSIHGGGGCLILAMAAIGALYEYEHPASKELFEAAKKMIGLYLEERRKADISATVNGATASDPSARDTPLWLVQAMLLNVIYGHQCGDRTAADIASNHCAALVSLARAADLAQPPQGPSPVDSGHPDKDLNDMEVDGHHASHTSTLHEQTDLQQQWLDWVNIEKRKRTLYAIFILSSLLTTAYNQTPTIMNSEILLELPCDEELWSAESAEEWQNRGGLAAVEANAISFAAALSMLLTANQRQGMNSYNNYSINPLGPLQGSDRFPEHELRPSTFGCLVLINALHNYIWETRSRHHGRQWTMQETESMFSHIEPALNAWQAAWKANEHHRLERPNPFGLGPLSADSIPLLDLAFVRLFVNLGRSKEAFWARDYDAMADELARGNEIVQHAEPSPDGEEDTDANGLSSPIQNGIRRASQAPLSDRSSSRRERHLRKAAFYAADSLTIACRYGLTYADITAHELPIQSAMCFFDCSQVLAEWACTVQERVGRYLGIMGRDNTDFSQVPAIMLLEAEDIELMKKIDQITESLEAKRQQHETMLSMGMNSMHGMPTQNNVNLNACGYGSKVLRAVGNMLEKAVVWPVTHVMAKALETQASHMDQRADSSCVT